MLEKYTRISIFQGDVVTSPQDNLLKLIKQKRTHNSVKIFQIN